MDTNKIYAESIVNQYSPKTTSKVIALKKLDRKAKQPANIFAFTFGIITTLVAGTGMCLSMEIIGPKTVPFFVLGIILGILGFVGAGVNYLIYQHLLEKGKAKYSFEIVELAKEICDEE